MAYDSRILTGVHGWLAFFVLTLGAITPLLQVFAVVGLLMDPPALTTMFGTNWPVARTVLLVESTAATAGSVYLAWLLLKRQVPETVRTVIIGLWAISIVPVLIELALFAAFTPAGLGSLPAEDAGGLVRPLVYAAIWTAYLLKSDRVANTYTYEVEEVDEVPRPVIY